MTKTIKSNLMMIDVKATRAVFSDFSDGMAYIRLSSDIFPMSFSVLLSEEGAKALAYELLACVEVKND